MMRVITGSARGVRLEAPAGESTRPTAERTKEAVFSMIQFEVEGRRTLDLFAGSGQMGIEAISRGAVRATFVDQSEQVAALIRRNLAKTRTEAQGTVVRSDYRAFLRTCRERYDLVFLDPPYALGAIPGVLDTMIRRDLLLPGALLICETGRPEDVFAGKAALEDRFLIRRRTNYGVAHIALLEWKGEDPA